MLHLETVCGIMLIPTVCSSHQVISAYVTNINVIMFADLKTDCMTISA